MRVPMVLLALVFTPLVAINAQSTDNNKCKARPAVNPAGQTRGNSAPALAAAPGQAKKGCAEEAPPPPVIPPPQPPPPTTETAEISGTAFGDFNADFVWNSGEIGLAGWTIELSGPVNASMVTDASGNYTFVGLAPGTYTVCQVPQMGWWQSLPMGGAVCASGNLGYTRVVTAEAPGVRFIGNDFGNVSIQ